MCVTPEEPFLSRRAQKLPLVKTFLSRELIAKRTANGETLVIIANKVYALDKWMKHHPGGALAIKHMAGS